jgi:hypothetical protein
MFVSLGSEFTNLICAPGPHPASDDDEAEHYLALSPSLLASRGKDSPTRQTPPQTASPMRASQSPRSPARSPLGALSPYSQAALSGSPRRHSPLQKQASPTKKYAGIRGSGWGLQGFSASRLGQGDLDDSSSLGQEVEGWSEEETQEEMQVDGMSGSDDSRRVETFARDDPMRITVPGMVPPCQLFAF